ncbi:hypothetical protein WA158_004672 [Blastocystis sp. Blastoise]
MIIDIEGLQVLFPFDTIYPEQYEYMVELKHAISVRDGNGHALLEMPTGTGKTISILSVVLAFQQADPSMGPLVYCTRTIPELNQCMRELKRLVKYRESILGKDMKPTLGICMSSRRNLCINPDINVVSQRETVDAECRRRTASWVRESRQIKQNNVDIEDIPVCTYYENIEKMEGNMFLPNGCYSMDELKDFARQKGVCPYFLTRQSLSIANVVILSYQYILDPRISSLLTTDLFTRDQSICVFDEGHNLEGVCMETLTVSLDSDTINNSKIAIKKIKDKQQYMKSFNEQKLTEEYNKLKAEIYKFDITNNNRGEMITGPPLPEGLAQRKIPGDIKKVDNFLTVVEHAINYLDKTIKTAGINITSAELFKLDMNRRIFLNETVLCHMWSRYNSMINTLQLPSDNYLYNLSQVIDFLTLLGTYSRGFYVISESTAVSSTTTFKNILEFCCTDPSIIFKEIQKRFQHIIITSGTLSPLDMYTRLLSFSPAVMRSIPLTMPYNCICPVVISRGNDQQTISTSYKYRVDDNVIKNYGSLVFNLCKYTPDDIYKYKLVFIESKNSEETYLTLQNYKRACDIGRGGLLICVSRGKVAEGVDFSGHYGRCGIMIGIPYQYALSRELRVRLSYFRDNFQIDEQDYYQFDALRQTAQCLGRTIRNKKDYSVCVFADARYNQADKRNKLPQWIQQQMPTSHLNLSVDMALLTIRQFLKTMAQPQIHEESLYLLDEENLKKYIEQKKKTINE